MVPGSGGALVAIAAGELHGADAGVAHHPRTLQALGGGGGIPPSLRRPVLDPVGLRSSAISASHAWQDRF